MIKFTSIVTVAVWAAVLVWFGSALLAGQLHQPSGGFPMSAYCRVVRLLRDCPDMAGERPEIAWC